MFQELNFINLIREKSHIVGNVLLGTIKIYVQNISFRVVNKNYLNLDGNTIFYIFFEFWREDAYQKF
jgi:hypothetical protein